MFKWDEIEYLGLSIILILLFIGYIILEKWKKRTQLSFADSHLFSRLVVQNSQSKYWLKASLLLASLFFLMIALIGPQKSHEISQMKREGIDLVFAVDISKSMDCEDVTPSRLIKAKKIIQDLTEQLAGDRVGLLIYAGSAHKMLAVTEDYSALGLSLEGINSDALSYQGTALSRAIEEGITCFDLTSEGDKTLIIFTDGEDHEENINDALAKAAKANINIITVGIGTTSGGVIPVHENGRIIGNKQNRMGQEVITKLNEDILKKIASDANGTYINGSNNTDGVIENLKQAFLKYKRVRKDVKDYTNYKLYYQYFAAIALILLVLELLVNLIKNNRVKK